MTGAWSGTSYIGDDSNDVATGTDANNGMWGNKGDDNLNGAGGDDNIDGGVGHDDLQGGDGNDRLWDFTGTPPGYVGLIGHDTLRGGAGDDHLNFWSPDTGDRAVGGEGFDTLEVRFNYNVGPIANVISFTLGRAPSVIKFDNADTVAVSQIERMLFVANDGNDFISGGEFNDTIAGMGGNDVLKGNDGDDVLEGGRGIQDIDGGKGFDRVSFDLSDTSAGIILKSGRTISLGASGTIRNAEQLSDVELGSGGDDVEIDQAGSISLDLNAGDDSYASKGVNADRVFGGQGADTIATGDGNDYVDPGYGSDLIKLGAGNDYLDYYDDTGTRNVTGDDRVYGGDGDDDIYTPNGDDYVDGGLGNDWLYGGDGKDTVIGGDGNDTVQAEGGADIVTGGEGNDSISLDYDYWSDTTPADNDRATGGAGNDTLTGGQGRDLIDAGVGDDWVRFGAGSEANTIDTAVDELLGGDGTDLLEVFANFGAAEEALKVSLGADIMIKSDGAAIAHAVSFERLYFNGNNSGDHVVTAGELNDSVLAGAGDSIFRMLGGADTVWAGAGSDTVVAGAGADLVVLHAGGADWVDLGSKNDSMILYDYLSADDLAGGIGGAVYDGGKGVDSLELWLTNAPGTTFDGQTVRYNGTIIGTVTGFETIKFNGVASAGGYNGTAAPDYVNLTSGDNAASGAGGNDTLQAAGGADTLDGGAGDDRIIGGAGADRLTGGADADTFVYALLSHSGGAAIDLITDFGAGDRIDLSAIDADTVGFGNQAFHLGGGGGHAGDIVLTYDSVNNRTAADLYVNADATIDGTIWLSGDRTALTADAFVL